MTYPVARKYKNSYYSMHNYYSVHLEPSERYKKKKTWIREVIIISYRGIDFLPVFFLQLYTEVTCYSSY